MSDACAKLNATVRLALVNTTNETLVFMDILREVLNVLHRLSLSLVSSSKAIQTQAPRAWFRIQHAQKMSILRGKLNE